jgi:rhodanese-related sulfurtransferase
MKAPSLTIGIEEEYQIIDPQSRELRSYITQILEDSKLVLREQVKAELHQSMVEVGTEEYCAILPRYPATHAEAWRIEAEEAKIDRSHLETLLDAVRVVDVRSVELHGASRDAELESIPEGAVVLDLRSRPAYQAWHAAGALHLEFFQALRSFASFTPDPTYVLYCEVGQKSAHLAELMRRDGFKAFHIRGGVRTLLLQYREADLLIT